MKAEKFIEVWQKARSIDEVVEKTGMSAKVASNKASLLRTSGIPLKTFKDVTAKTPAELRALAEKYAPRKKA